MIIPIRCFTCGKVIADKYDYYVAESKKLAGTRPAGTSVTSAVSAKNEISNAGLKNFDEVLTGPILDKLGLTRYCCRRHMIAHVDLIDII